MIRPQVAAPKKHKSDSDHSASKASAKAKSAESVGVQNSKL